MTTISEELKTQEQNIIKFEKRQPAENAESARKKVAEIESIFKKRISQTVESVVIQKAESWDLFKPAKHKVRGYYDKDGKLLYTREERNGVYAYKMSVGIDNIMQVEYVDRDKDGNMDILSVKNKHGQEWLYASDLNDDGKFDTVDLMHVQNFHLLLQQPKGCF